MLTEGQLLDIKARNPVSSIAGEWVKLRRKSRGKFIGACPICSNDGTATDATRFECSADHWVCAVCHDGGDVIRLIRKREGLSFEEAIERLGGTREEKPTPALAEKRGAQAFRDGRPNAAIPAEYAEDELRRAFVRGWEKEKRAEDAAAAYRERERERLYDFWRAGITWPGTAVAQYLAARGCYVPPGAMLRCHLDFPMFDDGRENEPLLLHSGLAMLAAIVREGKFSGLHITWLDASQPKGKAIVANPETGKLVPSKKVRGSKAGGFIDLGSVSGDARVTDGRPSGRMFAGEGIETVLSAYTALVQARMLRDDAFRSAIDLGNLAGRALETIPHPTLKTATGRAQRVPGPHPDLNSPAMPVPESVTELVLLGDGDSDPFLTRNAIERASRRHAADGRLVRPVWPSRLVMQ